MRFLEPLRNKTEIILDKYCHAEYTETNKCEIIQRTPPAVFKQIGGEDTDFYCLDCEGIFEHPARYAEYHDGMDAPGEQFCVCPFCKSTNFVPVEKCDVCSEYITGKYITTDDGQTVCENCYTVHDVTDA